MSRYAPVFVAACVALGGGSCLWLSLARSSRTVQTFPSFPTRSHILVPPREGVDVGVPRTSKIAIENPGNRDITIRRSLESRSESEYSSWNRERLEELSALVTMPGPDSGFLDQLALCLTGLLKCRPGSPDDDKRSAIDHEVKLFTGGSQWGDLHVVSLDRGLCLELTSSPDELLFGGFAGTLSCAQYQRHGPRSSRESWSYTVWLLSSPSEPTRFGTCWQIDAAGVTRQKLEGMTLQSPPIAVPVGDGLELLPHWNDLFHEVRLLLQTGHSGQVRGASANQAPH